jgi:hypothetical protein
MNAASLLRSKAVAVASAGFLGAGLLGGVAFAAVPATTASIEMTAPVNQTGVADAEKGRAKLKAALDALVAKNVISQAQEDAIIAALTADHKDGHPKLKEFVGDVVKESVDYIGLPAEAVKGQLHAGKSLGQIAGQQPGKSRDGLVADLHAKAEARIKAAVDAGKLTTEQATALRTKVDEAIVKIVDHEGAPRRDKTTPNAPAKPAAPTAKPTQ